MSKSSFASTALAVCILFAGLQLPSTAEARATVESRELVSRTRVGRTSYLYTYRLTLNNDGPSLNDVNVWALCDAPGTTMVDEIAEFGDIDADSVVQSTGTFSFRQDRRTPFDPDCLTYEIGFVTPLIISGQAVDDELSNALIVGTVIHPESGRPIVDSGRPIVDTFTTTADANGNFTLEMEAVMQEDFVTIEAMGVDEQTGGNLENDLGTVGALHDAGEDGSIIINPGNFGSDITHITTALAELAERENGGPILTDGELALAISQVDGAELLIMAAAIKTFIDNPGVPLPPGVNNTQELISNPAVFEEYVVFLDEEFNDEFTEAIVNTSENLSTDFLPEEIPGQMFAVFRDKLPLTGGAYQFDLDANGNGNVVLFNGGSPATWAIDAEGQLIVTLLNPPTSESFIFDPVTGEQIRTVSFVEQITIARLVNGVTSDQIFLLQRTRTTFPDSPGMPDTVVDDEPGPDAVHLSFREAGFLPILSEDVADDQIATEYYHQDNNSTGLNEPRRGADFLFFNADGSGVTQRRGFGFNWTSNADGSLSIQFANGDVTRYVIYSEDGDVAQAIVIGALANGVTLASSGEAIDFDGVSEFTDAMLTNRRYRSLAAVLSPEMNASPLINSVESIFNFDLTDMDPPPPYTNIAFGATFAAFDPVIGSDEILTLLYGDVDGQDLLQVRNDALFEPVPLFGIDGTTYGPLVTANPIFDPMLDGVFSIGFRAQVGTAIMETAFVSGLVNGTETARQTIVPEFSETLGPVFDFLFLPGGEGCRQSPGVNPFDWISTPENYMDLFMFTSFRPNVASQRRSWQAVAVVPGEQGDRYWVIENLDFGNQTRDPNYEYADPLTTPGRMNSYEFVEDLTGQVDACGFGSATSLDTTFDSNNGGTGNMFDVATGGNTVEVTGLNVNVEYPVDTVFQVDVLVTPISYQNTITAAPGCTFNCTFNAAAWVQVASGVGTSNGPDFPTFVEIGDFILDANSTTGVWVTLTRDGSVVDEFRYTNGTQSFEDNDITITTGAGVTGPFPGLGETLTTDRIWNGTIFYNTQ